MKKGDFWFFSRIDSNKNNEIKQDDHVQLLYAKPSDSHYLAVYGTADVFRDKEKAAELWTPMVKGWFDKGKDDPSITLIRVRPLHAYYWDTKDGKMITLLKVAVSALTGKQMDGSIEGTLKP